MVACDLSLEEVCYLAWENTLMRIWGKLPMKGLEGEVEPGGLNCPEWTGDMDGHDVSLGPTLKTPEAGDFEL